MTPLDRVVAKTVDAAGGLNVHRAVSYVSHKLVVAVTRLKYHRSGLSHTHYALKIGRPNYKQKKFIRKCLAAKEPFPVKRVQLQLVN